jgi:formate/nitrite transporter FocA (FNT family)
VSAEARRREIGETDAPVEDELQQSFAQIVDEGTQRLHRTWRTVLVTGTFGGMEVGVGVMAYLAVQHETGNHLLAGLAFGVGFVALLLAKSELFTENFLVPVTAVVAKEGTLANLARLWALSLLTNLLGGLLMAAMIVAALPDVRDTAIETGQHYAELGATGESFVLAVLAGLVITTLTRMQHATDSLGLKIVPAVMLSFVLVGTQLFHCVLDSTFMFAGLLTGRAPYGLPEWALGLGWSALGNLVGGTVLVTAVRLLRVGHRVVEERQQD